MEALLPPSHNMSEALVSAVPVRLTSALPVAAPLLPGIAVIVVLCAESAAGG